MFPQKERVNKEFFPIILKEGRIVHSDNLSLRFMELKDGSVNLKNRYSFVVSTKVSKLATLRNLLKRRGRYIIRKNANKIKTPFICVFFFKPGAVKLDFISLEKEFLTLLSRAKIF